MTETQSRTYRVDEVVRFRRTTEEFGGLSNMAPGFPLIVLGHRIRTAEALYQACRYPHMPAVQQMILDEGSPMTAKMRTKPFRSQSRPDWDEVRVPVMKWCLRVKLACNWGKFSQLLLETGERPIVEDSPKDSYWGAMPQEGDLLNGQNVLGRLLMDLRKRLIESPETLRSVRALPIPEFKLLGEAIPAIAFPRERGEMSSASFEPTGNERKQWSFL